MHPNRGAQFRSDEFAARQSVELHDHRDRVDPCARSL